VFGLPGVKYAGLVTCCTLFAVAGIQRYCGNRRSVAVCLLLVCILYVYLVSLFRVMVFDRVTSGAAQPACVFCPHLQRKRVVCPASSALCSVASS
jgi:hypothetical protein